MLRDAQALGATDVLCLKLALRVVGGGWEGRQLWAGAGSASLVQPRA